MKSYFRPPARPTARSGKRRLALSATAAAMILASTAGLISAAEAEQGTAADKFCPGSVGAEFRSQNVQFRKWIELEPITPGFAILEGPTWVGRNGGFQQGELYLSHIGYSTDGTPNPAELLTLDDRRVTVVDDDYGSNGLTVDTDGTIYAARHETGAVEALDGSTVLADGYLGTRFNSPNDLILSAAGNLYFSDPDWQAGANPPQDQERAYFVDQGGNVTAFGAEVEKPNGVYLSADETKLFVGGVNGLFVWNLDGDGAPGSSSTAVRPDLITGGVDGMSRDCAGNLYVAADGKLVVLDGTDFDLLGSFDIPGITNVAFGGNDGHTLFVTTLGGKPAVWQARVEIPGLPY